MTSILRWQTKKAARRTMALASWATGYLALSRRHGGPQIRVLTYHRFGELRRDPFCVTPKEFEQQMAFLAEQRLAISLAQFRDFIGTGKPIPRSAVLVTVDDGFRSLCSIALPILRHYAIPAVAFITPSLISAPAKSLDPSIPEAYLTWDEISKLIRGSVAIGSHALTHRSLGRLSPAEVEHEATKSRALLEHRLGAAVDAFAYPFGTRADFSPAIARILERSGYRMAFTSQHGAVRPGLDPLQLPRIKVEGGESVHTFRLLTQGGLDGWYWVDRTLWQLQARGASMRT